MQEQNIVLDQKKSKIPLVDKIIWSSTGFLASLPWVIVGYYLLYFYTDIVKMNPALAGTIIFGARMFDAVTDILIGWCIDNFHFKWGKYRSWVRFAIPANIILWPMVWASVEGAGALNLFFSILGYGCMGAIGSTLYYIPTNCQLIVMTKDEGERANLVAWKGVAGNLASVFAVAVFMPIVGFFGGGHFGFFMGAVIMLVPQVLILWLDYRMAKKYELNEDGTWKAELEIKKEAGKRIPLVKQLAELFKNRPAVIVVVGIFVMNIVMAFRNSVAVYVFNYYFEQPDMATPALTVMTIATCLGAFLMQPAIKIMKDTNRGYVMWTFLTAAVYILFWALCRYMDFAAAQASLHYGLLFWLFALTGLMCGAYYNFCYVELAMVADYGKWKYHRDQSGLIYSLNGFSLTAATALGGFFLGIALNNMGYEEGIQMDAAMKAGLLWVGLMIPSFLTIGHAVLQMFFGLTDKQYKVVKAELDAREAEEEALRAQGIDVTDMSAVAEAETVAVESAAGAVDAAAEAVEEVVGDAAEAVEEAAEAAEKAADEIIE